MIVALSTTDTVRVLTSRLGTLAAESPREFGDARCIFNMLSSVGMDCALELGAATSLEGLHTPFRGREKRKVTTDPDDATKIQSGHCNGMRCSSELRLRRLTFVVQPKSARDPRLPVHQDR